MFFSGDNFNYRYIPILAISPAEMLALEELPEKDKDLILPLFPLKGWVGSHKLKNTTERIKKSIGDRKWIACIDDAFLYENKEFLLTGNYPDREVFLEIERLLLPDDGFNNWYEFMLSQTNAIPSVLWGSPKNVYTQITKLSMLGRGVVIRVNAKTSRTEIELVFKAIVDNNLDDLLFILDLDQITRDTISQVSQIQAQIESVNRAISPSIFSVSSSSFPSSFSGYHKGENSIYERILFNKVRSNLQNIRFVYSDRGSARADKIKGGGGIPSPRIDYPLSNDWRFIRQEYDDSDSPYDGEKEELYTSIAQELIKEPFWEPELRLWGTQLIELTSLRDKYAINSPSKATAARINIHLHMQLHYDSAVNLIDTDDEWSD
ncbi:beta family protein [Idiomarina loihiensis]|uniref:beta family protein n=1 Tax=Idiomarina loihiensis TaxID=135577 RepID=UPI00315837DA